MLSKYISIYKGNHNYTNMKDVFKRLKIDNNILSNVEKKIIDEEGYIIFENYFDEKFFKEMNNSIDKITQKERNNVELNYIKEKGCTRIDALLDKDIELFKKCVIDKKILAAVSYIFNGEEFHLGSVTTRTVKPGYGDQDFHMDRQYKDVDYSVNIIIALTDLTNDNGTISVIPKSHIKSYKFNENSKKDEKLIICKAG